MRPMAARIVALPTRRVRPSIEGMCCVRYVIVGAGAVGGSIGACLFANGHDVTLVARGAHLTAINENGLRLETPEGPQVHAIPAVAHPKDAAVSEGDVVLLAVKSQDTEAAISSLEGSVPFSTPIFCLQNGVENERAVLRRFPNVYGGMVIVPATYLSPGTVSVGAAPTFGICDVGRFPEGIDEIAVAFAAALNESRWSSHAIGDIMRWKYAKLLDNLSNAVQVALGLEHRDSEIAKLARAEGVAVLEAIGIDTVSTPEMRERRASSLTSRPVAGQERVGASTWQSVARGAGSIETDYLNGEISLLGRIHGIPTPANALLQEVSADVIAGRSASGSVAESDLLAQLA